MAKEIVMPKMGDEMTEGKLVNWLKHAGETVSKGEPLAEIETDKVTVEIEAADSGVLQRLLVAEGQMVPVGEIIAFLITAEEGQVEEKQAPPARATNTQIVQQTRPLASDPPPAQAGHRVASRSVQSIAEKGPSGPTKNVTPSATLIYTDAPPIQNKYAKASPLARRIAQEHGIDLVAIRGTGPGGRVVRHDVEDEVKKGNRVLTPTVPPMPAHPRPLRVLSEETLQVQPGGPPETPPVDEQVLTRLQQTMARRMLESKTSAPHFYLTAEIDVTETMALRSRLNREVDAEEKISVNDLILKAVAKTLPRFPALNATFAGDRLLIHKEISIAVAVAIKDGLVTPVVRHVDEKAVGQIARETKGLAERARSGKSRVEDYAVGTFTVSNLGMFGIDTFIAIINPPHAAILAVGAVRRLPVYVGDDLVPRERMSVTLSADHRVTDGATGAQFLGQLRSLLENPLRLLV
jgi:pyruvate dehydrogenase E2 component (dihydrolipoamide acetyltransferase)